MSATNVSNFRCLEQRIVKLDANHLSCADRISKSIVKCIERFALATGTNAKEDAIDKISDALTKKINCS